MIFAIDEALKTYKERVTELEMEMAMLGINVKQERSSASALAKAARKEAASLCKDLSTTRAELTKAKEHAVDSTDIRNGLRKAAHDLAAAISERDAAMREVPALREAGGAVLFDVPRIETAMRTFVAGLWDALGWVAHVQEERKAAWARSAEADSTLMSVTSDSTAGAQSYAHMPLESANLLLATSEGSSDVGSGTVCVAMKLKESTPVALAEAIASESATYGSSGGGASLTTTEDISTDDTRATRQASISTILTL
ncbi:hypothetical protein K525DRAFT_270769 [Schizophyllum commune Loenen D]|nr:hypothetical protein K525DRAFT_270769 [Schizophyllum commune Loenen D]